MTATADADAVTDSPTSERWQHLALLLTLSCLFLFLGLGELGLTDRDEGSNAEAAREMVETGNWVSPTLNYEPRFAKPAFVYWLMSGAYLLFGASEFSARFHSAVFGVGLIVLQYVFLRRLRDPMLALMSALMLFLNIEIVAIGRAAMMDSVLIFFTTLSLFCFWLGVHGEGRARHLVWGFYLGMALGTLTKGPVGFMVPWLVVIPYLTVMRRWSQFWERGFPVLGMLLFFALATPWYVAMLAIHGDAYTASASANTIGRFLTVIGGHGGTVLFYVPVIAFGFFPWSGFLPVALYQAYQAWKGTRQGARGKGETEDSNPPFITASPSPLAARPPSSAELEIFAALWLAAGFLFFSLSATRLPHYIGPLYPAAAILVASYVQRCLAEPTTPGARGSFRLIAIVGYLLGILLAAGPALYSTFLDQVTKEFPMAAEVSTGLSPVVAGVILFVGSGLIGYFGHSESGRTRALWAAGTTIGVVMLLAIQVALPHFHKYFISPPQQLAYIAGSNLGPDDRFIVFGRSKPSFIFYAKRKMISVDQGQNEKLVRLLHHPGRTMVLLPSRLHASLPEEAKDYPVLLRYYGYMLIANQPMVRPSQADSRQLPEPPRFHGTE